MCRYRVVISCILHMSVSFLLSVTLFCNHSFSFQKDTNGFSVTLAELKTITPQSFGATADGKTDDTLAIQAAIDYLERLNTTKFNQYGAGGILYFPRGTYLISRTLTIQDHNITLKGESSGASIIICNAAGLNTIEIYNPDYATGANIRNVNFEDLVFIHDTQNPTSGSHLEFRRASECSVTRCSLINHHVGIELLGVDEGFLLHDSLIQQGGNTTNRNLTRAGIKISALPVSSSHQNAKADGDHSGVYYVRPSSIHISDSEIKATKWGFEHAIDINSVDGLYITNCHIAWAYNSLLHMKPLANNQPIINIHIDNSLFDATAKGIGGGDEFTRHSIYIENNKAIRTQPGIRNIRISNCSLSGKGDKAVYVESGLSNVGDIKISNTSIKGSANEGILLESGEGYLFSNITLENNCNIGRELPQMSLSNVRNVTISNIQGYGGGGSSVMIGGDSNNIIINSGYFQDYSKRAIAASTSGKNLIFNGILSQSPQTVLSSSRISVPAEFNFITVTGSSDINYIDDTKSESNSSWNSRVITLLFTGGLTVNDKVGNINLSNNFKAADGATLTLTYNSANQTWNELSRSH